MTDRWETQSSKEAGEFSPEACTDDELVVRILAGDRELFGVVMHRHATRLYRIAFSVLRDPSEAEDVVQDAYLRAYRHLHQYAGRAKFGAWLSRITVHEALARRPGRARYAPLDLESGQWKSETLCSPAASPEEEAVRRQMIMLIASVARSLPEHYRLVLYMRDLREFDVAQTARLLGLTKQNVKVRLHRAHTLLRREVHARINMNSGDIYSNP